MHSPRHNSVDNGFREIITFRWNTITFVSLSYLYNKDHKSANETKLLSFGSMPKLNIFMEYTQNFFAAFQTYGWLRSFVPMPLIYQTFAVCFISNPPPPPPPSCQKPKLKFSDNHIN